MRKILNYIWRIWFVLLASILFFIFAAFVLIFSIKASHFKYAYIFIRLWCLLLFYGMGFRYELINQTGERLEKDKQYIIISNHTSIIDIMLMCVLHPRQPICFIGKAELAKIPIFSIVYKRVCILVDRKNLESRANVYKKAALKMNDGQNLVVFPEGGVPDDTSIRLDEFKDGAFKMSSEHKIPIAVYTFFGLKEMFPFQNDKGFPGSVKVYFNGILYPSTNFEENKLVARDKIKKTLETEYSQS